jgi:hypothetical protein
VGRAAGNSYDDRRKRPGEPHAASVLTGPSWGSRIW